MLLCHHHESLPPPLHFWLPLISIYINWTIILVFFSIQKIIPFIFISLIKSHSVIPLFVILIRVLIPPFIIFKITNLKKIMAYSSINQIGWIYLIILISSKLWLIYLCFYSISILIVTNVIKIIYPLTINNWININLNLKLLSLIIIINMSGLPPFRLFFIKWYRVILIISSIKFNIIVIIILVM